MLPISLLVLIHWKQKAKLLNAEFFSFTQIEFSELDISKKEELFKEFNIKESNVN